MLELGTSLSLIGQTGSDLGATAASFAAGRMLLAHARIVARTMATQTGTDRVPGHQAWQARGA
jgi:hypothetical protein